MSTTASPRLLQRRLLYHLEDTTLAPAHLDAWWPGPRAPGCSRSSGSRARSATTATASSPLSASASPNGRLEGLISHGSFGFHFAAPLIALVYLCCAGIIVGLPRWPPHPTDRSTRRAALALTDLVELPLRRAPHRPLLARCWELRQNITVYDAAYVALAELLDVVLLTADARLASAPGPRCQLELLD